MKKTLVLGLTLSTLVATSYAANYYGASETTTATTNLVVNDGGSHGNIIGGGDNISVGGTSLKLESFTASNIVAGGNINGGDVNGNINLEMTGGTVNTWLMGGNYQSTGVVTGDIDIKITGGSVSHGVRGGSMGGAYNQVVEGNVNVYIGGDSVIGGADGEEAFSAAGSYAYIKKDLTLTIADNAKIVANIYGGGGRTLSDNSFMDKDIAKENLDIVQKAVENVTINIKGGDIQANVYGGAMKYSAVESTKINISGGKIAGDVFAGGGQDSAEKRKHTIVRGDANINISGGVIEGNVYASGSNSTALIEGKSTVTLTNNAVVKGTIAGSVNGAVVEGTKTFNFGNENVAFTGRANVAGFDVINVQGASNAELSSYVADASGTAINIFSGSTLTLNMNADAFGTTALDNAGSLIFKKGSLNSVSFGSYTGEGTVFGGSFTDNVFTFGAEKAKDSSAITAAAPVAVQKAETLAITDTSATGEEGKSEEAMKVNKVSIATSSKSEDISVKAAEVIDFTEESFESTGMELTADENILTAWTFEIEGVSEDNGVVLSFYVGDDFNIDGTTIWHRGKDGKWENVTSTVNGLTFSNGEFSFIATTFSDYALTTTVPEPAEIAAIFGALALGFAIYRRRK